MMRETSCRKEIYEGKARYVCMNEIDSSKYIYIRMNEEINGGSEENALCRMMIVYL